MSTFRQRLDDLCRADHMQGKGIGHHGSVTVCTGAYHHAQADGRWGVDYQVITDGEQDTRAWVALIEAAPKLQDDRDRLLAALKAILEVANVRIDDPRCAVFDEAREAVRAAEGDSEL